MKINKIYHIFKQISQNYISIASVLIENVIKLTKSAEKFGNMDGDKKISLEVQLMK